MLRDRSFDGDTLGHMRVICWVILKETLARLGNWDFDGATLGLGGGDLMSECVGTFAGAGRQRS